MGDLTIHSAPTCLTNIEWSAEVKGATGKVYVVTWGHQPTNPDVQYDYSCTCPAFKHRSDHCKHIREVITKKLRCGWNETLEPTEQARDGKCPGCGGEVRFERVAV